MTSGLLGVAVLVAGLTPAIEMLPVHCVPAAIPVGLIDAVKLLPVVPVVVSLSINQVLPVQEVWLGVATYDNGVPVELLT